MDWEGFFTHYRKPGFIPGYEIVNKLGSGVFGEVYKARKESIGKFYAIKFLKVSDEKVSEAIFKELDSLRYFAQLDHPNLVSIEDKGEVMGIPYIVMGYGGDHTLKRRLAEGRLGAEQIDSIFSQICRGVAALHEKSIIHFDLKPANIFMKGDHARVGDYGLSKLVSESANTMSIGRGTPYYMAPEMLRRRGDGQSDIYSLGVILYEMAIGQVPFKGDSEWEVLRKHENDPVIFPAEVDGRYRAVIERAMQKDPARRFESVAQLLEVFESRDAAQLPTPHAPRPAGPALGSPATPPPLPGSAARAAGPVARKAIERDVQAMVRRVEARGGTAAARAREIYRSRQEAAAMVEPLPEERGFGSFYADFEGGEAAAAGDGPSRFVEPLAPAQPALAPGPRRRGPLGTLVHALAWPLRALFRMIGAFFHNFFRYTIVLAITAGLLALIHMAIFGPSFL